MPFKRFKKLHITIPDFLSKYFLPLLGLTEVGKSICHNTIHIT